MGKYNSKTTEIWCVRCCKLRKVSKSNGKYCSTLCRNNERNYRIYKGLTYSKFKGSRNALKEYYAQCDIPLLISFPFRDELNEFDNLLKTNNMSKSWKQEYGNYILYYFENLKVDKFELYYNEIKNKSSQITITQFEATSGLVRKGYRKC